MLVRGGQHDQFGHRSETCSAEGSSFEFRLLTSQHHILTSDFLTRCCGPRRILDGSVLTELRWCHSALCSFHRQRLTRVLRCRLFLLFTSLARFTRLSSLTVGLRYQSRESASAARSLNILRGRHQSQFGRPSEWTGFRFLRLLASQHRIYMSLSVKRC